MEHPRRAPLAITALLVTATLATSCAAGPRPEASPSRPPAASGGSTSETLPDTVVPTAASAAAAAGTGQNRGGSGRTPALTARRLPADWPSDLPVPPGQLQGSTGAAGQWTALILVSGSAVQVKKSAVDFYLAAGFRAETDSILRRGPHRITLVVENRDHSPTNTYLAIGVTTG